MPCWWAVRSTLMMLPWVAAPDQVRFPPHTLRLTTAGRMACSACRFVASTTFGWVQKVNRASASTVRLWHRRSRWALCRRRHKAHYADVLVMPMLSCSSWLEGSGLSLRAA